MALSALFVDNHISTWQANLTTGFYAHRKHWPANLFHHAPIENAVGILRDGCIRSRNDAQNQRARDVAAPGVIDAREHAHNSARLYFRPKTPTQWHIEGVRKVGECSYGEAAHAPVFVMFLLDAKSILTRENVRFSSKNMQLHDTIPGNTEEYFSEIPFAKVFSEGSTGGDRSYTDARCAEVLCDSPLDLRSCLKNICFRSEPERETLLFMLGDPRRQWERYCQVSDALKVFQKEYTFVQHLSLKNEGVLFRLNPRRDRNNIEIKINIWNSVGDKIGDFYNSSHAPLPPNPNNNWIWKKALKNDVYIVEIFLEKHLAYKNSIVLGDTLF